MIHLRCSISREIQLEPRQYLSRFLLAAVKQTGGHISGRNYKSAYDRKEIEDGSRLRIGKHASVTVGKPTSNNQPINQINNTGLGRVNR